MQHRISQRIRELFYQAIQFGPEGRTNWVDSLDTQDRALVAEVESLLASFEDAGNFLAEPPTASPELKEPAGTQIAHFVIQRHIGEGGFGDIYLAEQSEPMLRRVALKIIKPGMDSRDVLRRFRAERQTLALLEHPNIARIIDAGATPAGRPYFVMELVDGPRITRYCDEHLMPIAGRIELFLRVCDAVQHAHQRGVIHRDLKPANVLVSEMDGKPTPKVIDFGIAKVLRSDQAADHSVTTVKPGSLGTPAYMSPEQMRGETVDTRTDIYSLGVLLYELLCGRLPFDPAVRAGEAPTMTYRLGSAERAGIELAAARATTPTVLLRTLRGELDWIVARCLPAERDERYPTVNALMEDLLAFLAGQPVRAAPPSRSYRIRKFVARHRAAVLSLTLAVLGLLAVALVMTQLAFRATRAERLAQKRLEDAEAVNDFLTQDMIGSAEPTATRGNREMTVREALDNAANALPGKFPDRPLTQAAVRNSVAMAYLTLGRADLALPHAQNALEQRRAVLGDEHPDTVVTMNNLAIVLRSFGRFGEAESLFKRALDTCHRVLPPDHDHTLSVLNNYSTLLMALGRWSEAEALVKEARQQSRRVRGDDHEKTILATVNYAHALKKLARATEAESLLRETLNRSQRVNGEDHPLTLLCAGSYANALHSLGRSAEAEQLYKQVLERHRRVLGDDHPDTLASLDVYAEVLGALGRYGEAEPIHKEALERYRRIRGEDHPDTLTSQYRYARALQSLGRPADAESLHREALASRRRTLGDDHPDTLASMDSYAYTLRLLGRTAEAEPLLLQVLQKRRSALGEDHPDTIQSLNNYASFLQFVRRYSEAAPLHREALDRRRRVLGEDHRLTLGSLNNYANVLRSLGQTAEAEPLARQAWEKHRQSLGPDHPDTILVLNNYATTISLLGRHADAEPLYQQLYQSAARAQITPARAARFMAEHGPCLVRLGRYEQAEVPLREAYRRLSDTQQANSPAMRQTLEALADVCERTDRAEDARRLRQESSATTTQP
jgi:serine/threonine protein kinase/tetratricopeptide (TPR) repeat protein